MKATKLDSRIGSYVKCVYTLCCIEDARRPVLLLKASFWCTFTTFSEMGAVSRGVKPRVSHSSSTASLIPQKSRHAAVASKIHRWAGLSIELFRSAVLFSSFFLFSRPFVSLVHFLCRTVSTLPPTVPGGGERDWPVTAVPAPQRRALLGY